MLKVALRAAAVALAASTVTAGDAVADAAAMPAMPADTTCRPGAAPQPACAPRAGEADPDAVPADLANLAAPAPIPADWAPPRSDGGLAFKDAATDSASVLPAGGAPDRPQRLAPALLALGALVILLRRRPT